MENYYYLNDKNIQQGPIPADQLTACGVTRNTKVWKQGMSQWLPAGEIPELASLFATPPVPPVPPVPPTPPIDKKPDNLLVWSILATVLCCLPLGIAAIIYSNKVDPLWNEGKYEEAKKAAETAKMYCIISLVVGILSYTIGFFFGLLGAL